VAATAASDALEKLRSSRKENLMGTSEGRGPETQPIEQPSAHRVAAAGSSRTRPRGEPRGERSARILVVDDNVDLARGLARLLRIHGHDVQIAHDGPSGLDKAKESKPDVVLLDIGLPGMDGYQVAAHLRQDETVKGATLIAISGYGQEEDRRLAMEAGFDHHLVKPIASEDLIRILEESEA
jgi:CheY-like chemotaxis protein